MCHKVKRIWVNSRPESDALRIGTIQQFPHPWGKAAALSQLLIQEISKEVFHRPSGLDILIQNAQDIPGNAPCVPRKTFRIQHRKSRSMQPTLICLLVNDNTFPVNAISIHIFY